MEILILFGLLEPLTVSANVNECKMVQPPDKVEVKRIFGLNKPTLETIAKKKGETCFTHTA